MEALDARHDATPALTHLQSRLPDHASMLRTALGNTSKVSVLARQMQALVLASGTARPVTDSGAEAK